jgi:uncharacterized membrane protein
MEPIAKKMKGWFVEVAAGKSLESKAAQNNSTSPTIKRSGMAITLNDQKIQERWGQIVEHGNGRADAIYKMTQEFLKEGQIPGVAWEFTDVKTGIFGSKRVYLLVTNEALKDFRMYIAARDYGSYLDVQWYMTVEPGFLKSTISRAIAGEGGEQAMSWALNIFDQQELSAYATTVHSCLLKAVDTVRKELGQDPSKFNRKSKGFLEVWG